MASVFSDRSKVSLQSQKLIEDVARKSTTKMYKLNGFFDDEDLRNTWNAFGLYISRQLRMGRAISIPGFGLFTFTAPDVNLNGVTNPSIRDRQLRDPVFIVAKEFAHGLNLKSGISSQGVVRPYAVHGVNGKMPQTMINYTEIGIYCSKQKDQAKQCTERVIRQLEDEAKKKSSVDMEIPNVGVFQIRSQIAVVNFNEFLVRDAKKNTNPNKPLSLKKEQGEMKLTQESLKQFKELKTMEDEMKLKNHQFLEIDHNAKEFLKQSLNIDFNKIFSDRSLYRQRPMTAQHQQQQLIQGKLGTNMEQQQTEWSEYKTQMQRPQTAKVIKVNKKPASAQQSNRNNNLGLILLQRWIRDRCLCSEDAFVEFSQAAKGQAQKNTRLTQEDIYNGMKQLNFEVTPQQITELHRQLDFNKDGFIDQSDWVQVLSNDGNAYLQSIKDVIAKNHIKVDDLLRTMKLQRDQKSINSIALKDALKKIDTNLNDLKAFSAAKAILQDAEYIDAAELLEELGCEQEELDEAENYINPNWYNDMLLRIKKKLIQNQQENNNSQDPLKQAFERLDLERTGRIAVSKFKTCFINLQLGFHISEINRLARFVEKEPDNEKMVNYEQFLQCLDRIQKKTAIINNKFATIDPQKGDQLQQQQSQDSNYFIDLSEFSQRLILFMQKNNVKNSEEFLKKVQKTTGIDELKSTQLTSFLFKYGFPQSTEEELAKYVYHIDIDKDGIISEEDLQTFINRINYLDQGGQSVYSAALTQQQVQNPVKRSPTKPIKEEKLFPLKPLDQKDMIEVLRALKQKLYLKKLSFMEFFKLLDSNQDGFITVDEFNEKLDSITKYSKAVKDGLFATLDKHKIGMIDFQTFVQVLEQQFGAEVQQQGAEKKNEENKKGVKIEETWEWTQKALRDIRTWYQQEGISVEDAFRVFDKDFDGYVGKSDISDFLIEVLHYSEKEIDIQRINRLYKLIDQFKRGQIELTDLRRLLTEEQQINKNFAVTGGKFVQGRTSFDWKLNAKQQIGIVLSRKFNSLIESFHSISDFGNRIICSQFEKWVRDSRALIGFDLSEQMTKIVFSDLDPHKKGYLTEKDWIAAFSGYNWRNQVLCEVKETVKTYFKSKNEAFEFFQCENEGPFITKESFTIAIRMLFQQRFTSDDIEHMWNSLSNKNSNRIDIDDFTYIYEENNETQKKQQSAFLRPKTAPIAQKNGNNQQQPWVQHDKTDDDKLIDEECDKVAKKVKQVLRASNKSIIEVFKEFDTDGSGDISNIEFKNAFRSMNIGLTSREIDLLLNYCDESGDGVVNWIEFANKFQLNDSQQRIIERSKQRLQHLNDNIHYYMLSPKDAFRLFNEDRSGLMKYQDFHRLMVKLCQMANETLPPFSILKDIFQTIDIRKDGKIDMTEWVQTFKQFKPPDASMQGRPMQMIITQPPRVQSAVRLKSIAEEDKEDGNKQLPHFIESSKEYDKLMQVIGRNRKYLHNIFAEINKREPVTYQVTKSILENMLRSMGIVIDDKCYPLLIKFAERDGVVDFRFLLEVYKERTKRISLQPAAIGNN